jgi:hypothetical protein
METDLERVDQKLVAIQVELQKLGVIVERLRDRPQGGGRRLKSTIRHHRAALIDSSSTITQKIEQICLRGD